MKRNLRFQPGEIFLLTLASLLLLLGAAMVYRPDVASAHPLGNFTINRYTRIELHPARIDLRYVLDLAEIPAFQERDQIDLDRNGQIDGSEEAAYLASQTVRLRDALSLTIDGAPIPLEMVSRELSFPPGQGGLPTMRLSMLLQVTPAPDRPGELLNLHYEDHNYRQRPGWREIVVRAAPGVSVVNSTAPQQDRSDELRAYPDDLLSSPPESNEAHLDFVTDGSLAQPAASPVSAEPTAPDPAPGRSVTSLITGQRLSLPVITLACMLALGLGATHALAPGHGKTIMAAYLVGNRGTARHALFLGFTVTISHSLGVLGLGLVTLYFSRVISPERLYPWLGLVSGVTIAGVGIWILAGRLRHHHHDPVHQHDRRGHHHHFDSTGGPGGIGWKNLAALGAANGLVPSASALIILLAAISWQHIGLGLLLVLAFSAGMAGVLSGTGIILVCCGRMIERFRVESAWSKALVRVLPVGTALVIIISGLVVASRSVMQGNLL